MKKNISDMVRKYRLAHNYDQTSLAQLAGVSRGAITYIESDTVTSNEQKLDKIAKARGTTWLDMIIATALPKWMDAGKSPHLTDENGTILPEVLLGILKDALENTPRRKSYFRR